MISNNAMKHDYIKYLYEECKRENDYPNSDIYKEIYAFLANREGKRGLKLYIEKHKKSVVIEEKDEKIAAVIRQLAELKRYEPK